MFMISAQRSPSRLFCFFSYTIAFSFILGCSSDPSESPTKNLSEEDIELLSETMGHILVENLSTQDIQINFDQLVKGIENAQTGKSPPLSKKEYFNLLMTHKQKILQIKSSENLGIAEDFLADNRNKPDVNSIEKGKLHYKILKEGSGPTVQENGSPIIHYEGKFINGQVFDSTAKKGKPIALPLESTIPGLQKGLPGMREGEKRRLFIHPDLGFGSRGRLPPNSLLIFDIEVVKAESKKAHTAKDQRRLDQAKESARTPDGKETGFTWFDRLTEPIF